MTYNVSLFETKNSKKANHIRKGFENKAKAIKHSEIVLDNGEYAVAVITSSDKSFTKTLTNETLNI